MHATVDARAEVRKWLPVLKATFRLTQNGFAREAGVDPSILSRWLNGRVQDSAAEAKALATLRKYRRLVDREQVRAKRAEQEVEVAV